MTLTFRDIMTADASELDDAAAAFRRMGKRFGELHTDYDTRVRGQVSNSSWSGLAKVSYDGVARVSSGQFGAAKRQAQNIATLLTKAYDDLADRKRTLGRRVKAAEKDKMSVDGDGRVTLDTTKLNEGERVARGHDHTYAEALDEEVAKWQARIDAAVEAVNDTDAAIKKTLIAAVKPPDGRAAGAHGFNPDKVEYTPPGTRQDLDRILRDYQVDPDPGGVVEYPRNWILHAGAGLLGMNESVTAREADMLDGLGLNGLEGFKDVQGKAFDTADDRFAPEIRNGAPNKNDNHNDAFRHTYWNALMTKKYGAEWTEKYATTHETRPGNQPEREAMDLYNNEIGRRIAQDNPDASDEELADLVEKAVRKGDTVVVDHGGGRLAFSDQISSRETGEPKLQPPERQQPNKSSDVGGGSAVGDDSGS
ncbi:MULTISPECIES: DUF6973 domain-containing protein [unclassified Streptomyces]|uniref:DUF6973 domain-containing protein n=1 Tax=unclassified Streptomyces TaxID=2593676 RepID=UPI002DDAA329|nr:MULTISPECIES: hypothetical protein [unclassified Streptomyces]WSA96625.1 hypothetical protein OIE63_37525 [Streptomyces sp. NBC_01795]WSB81038.1 hypothetical protein OHB04_38635 [Streptomyces sp. NBC_01775]WSS10751.1 hypothetical protein OG533_01620 [Streptomyces sp. NBC_01186]WSS39448.1 hypothetical protein OG220_01655 [Streptomyces sp. NBC_01187]